MIIDRLLNPSPLFALPSRLARALEYLRATDMQSAALGRHDIEGDHLFALVQEYTTRPADQCVWEAHRRYVDVQYVVTGAERMGVARFEQMRVREAYDASRDVVFFEPGAEFVTIDAGMFAIFGPEDVHSPCHAAGEAGLVRKVVVKAMLNAE